MASVLRLEFGEKVLHSCSLHEGDLRKDDGKIDITGFSVGVRQRSSEIWVRTAERTWKVRSCDDCERMSDGHRTPPFDVEPIPG